MYMKKLRVFHYTENKFSLVYLKCLKIRMYVKCINAI